MLRQGVAAASGRPDPAFIWLQEVERKSVQRPADPGEFASLDTKLAAGPTRLRWGVVGRQLTIKEHSIAEEGRRIKGNQILNRVYEYNRLDEANGALFTIEDILHIELKGDKLAKFKSDLGRYHHQPE